MSTEIQETDEQPITVQEPVKRRKVTRRATPKRNVTQQRSPERDHRPANIRTTRRSRGAIDGTKRRIPLVDLGPNYVGHWFVDDDGDPEKGTCGSRIEYAYKNDWDFVKVNDKGAHEITDKDLGTNMSQVANRTVGGAKQYLMAKPREMYDADRKNGVDKRNDEIEAALKPDRALKSMAAGDDKHFYTAQR